MLMLFERLISGLLYKQTIWPANGNIQEIVRKTLQDQVQISQPISIWNSQSKGERNEIDLLNRLDLIFACFALRTLMGGRTFIEYLTIGCITVEVDRSIRESLNRASIARNPNTPEVLQLAELIQLALSDGQG